MAADDPKPDMLHIKREAARGHHMHYNREERLMMKAAGDDQEKTTRRRVRKIGTLLYIILGLAIAALLFVILYKYIM